MTYDTSLGQKIAAIWREIISHLDSLTQSELEPQHSNGFDEEGSTR